MGLCVAGGSAIIRGWRVEEISRLEDLLLTEVIFGGNTGLQFQDG